MTGHDRAGRASALILVVFGSLLLVSGLLAAGQAVARGDWPSVAVTVVLMVLIGFGVLRGVHQLRRPGRADGDGGP